MSEEQTAKEEVAPALKWPAQEQPGVVPPVTHVTLASAAARAAATNSRRDLVDYLRLRRKPA